MQRRYNERRNRQVIVLIERRKVPPKEVPLKLVAMGFALVTYETVRQIIAKWRRERLKEGNANIIRTQ